MKSYLFLFAALSVCVGACHASPIVSNMLICPQNISGVFTLYGSNDVIQNGVSWNYGPFSSSTPATITLNHVNTTNQLQGITPGLIMEPAVICKGEANGTKFVFMADPLSPEHDYAPHFWTKPVGLIAWQFYNPQ